MKPPHPLVLMGLLSCLFGCGSDTPYAKKDGEWYFKKDRISTTKGETLVQLNKHFAKSDRAAYYESSQITGDVDMGTFEALEDHYAKDKNTVWYCDSYRDSKEYWTIKRYRTDPINGADAGSFRMLDPYYARDTSFVYHDGKPFTVRDINTYVRVGYQHAKDKVSGYYMRTEIKGSDGATFSEVDSKYSKDAKHVYYSDVVTNGGQHPGVETSIALPGADPATFAVIDNRYAADNVQAYYDGRVLAKIADFKFLGRGYAIVEGKVVYDGAVLKDADAATFKVLEVGGEEIASAEDKNGKFQFSERIRK